MNPREIAALKQEILSSLHCAMPGIVESFSPETQTVSVHPVFRLASRSSSPLSSRPERSGVEGSFPPEGSVPLPLIRDVPVFFPGTRTGAVTWPVEPGDECLLVFADFDIDRWFVSGEADEPASARQHDLADAFAFVGFRSRGNALADFPEEPGFFGVSGALPLDRGGSGQAATGATSTISDIAVAESGCSITTAQYAWWGKIAMVRLVVKKTAAVSSGTITLCTLVSGKRPRYNAIAQNGWGGGAQIQTTGRVQVNGAISAGASLTILSTYVLA